MEILRGGGPRLAASPVEEVLHVPVQSLGEYFRSHPPARERILIFEKEIAARGWNVNQAQKPMPIRTIFLAEQAERLDRRGLFDRAIARYEEALKIDPSDARTWGKLAQARWRSGDAAGTLAAASECVKRDPNHAIAWQLLAQSLEIEEPAQALQKFDALTKEYPPRDNRTPPLILAERTGLALKADRETALRSFESLATSSLAVTTRAQMRSRLAWWMYRAGDDKQAKQQLEIAHQTSPFENRIRLELAWVESDLGRQAAAQEALDAYQRGEQEAASAALAGVIQWRIDRKKEAEECFRRAAERDPVWIVGRWVENNYSAEAAGVLSKLRTAEIARRRLEEIRAGRIPSGSATKAPPR
jgi:tetratricopeptide (TPR) repeat protein